MMGVAISHRNADPERDIGCFSQCPACFLVVVVERRCRYVVDVLVEIAGGSGNRGRNLLKHQQPQISRMAQLLQG